MSLRITEDCIGCGACEYECNTGAIAKTDEFLGRFVIDSWACNDCARCVDVCPVEVIVDDKDSVVCEGKGCPVTAGSHSAVAGWSCSRAEPRCPSCGNPLWGATPGDVACPRCQLSLRQYCPKFGRATARAKVGAGSTSA